MIEQLRVALASRGIELLHAADGREALRLVLERIPKGATVMNGGSATLEDIGLLDALRGGAYKWLRPAIAATNEREERTRRRRPAVTADWLVGRVNAITLAGEVVNLDGLGNRLRGYV